MKRSLRSTQSGINYFHLYEVPSAVCKILYVTVISAENITQGFQDVFDTPDPYLVLKIPKTANEVKKTTTGANSPNHVWNEDFTFFIPKSKKTFKLELCLYDEDVLVDDKIGTASISLNSFSAGIDYFRIAEFGNNGKVRLRLRMEYDSRPDLRFGMDLIQKEKDYLTRRKAVAFDALQKLLSDEDRPTTTREVPVVAMLGSGGGFRAMISYSGVYKALCDTGLIDIITYSAAVSGSTWWQSFLYSHPDFPEETVDKILRDLRELACGHKVSSMFLNKSVLNTSFGILSSKLENKQRFSFTDIFGVALQNILFKQRPDLRLSQQQKLVSSGRVPFPIYASVIVNPSYSALQKHQWLEWNPFELAMGQWNTHVPIEKAYSKFYLGRVVKYVPEPPLHYLLAIWGSAFSVHLPRLAADKNPVRKEEYESLDEDDYMREFLGNQLDKDSKASDDDSDSDVAIPEESQQSSQNNDVPEKTRRKTTSIWNTLMVPLLSSHAEVSRKLLSAFIFNPIRGTKPTALHTGLVRGPTTDCSVLSSRGCHMCVVDAALANNLPFAPLLCPERKVDVFLTFEFTTRLNDETPLFRELLRAEEWASLHRIPFPPIKEKAKEYSKDTTKEYYVFKNDSDYFCPTILHFPIVNNTFREFSRPGVERETEEEKDFGNFWIFSDPKTKCSTFKFDYTQREFDRLSKLMEYNTLQGQDVILETLASAIRKKQAWRRAAYVKKDSEDKQ